ncbi:dihydroxyacetone kinase subunit DhaL [Alicyclobacillus sp. SO9]|uniref:dihydroxyacetone kinase subunit DhaL n=1 Tax=Alicyclobacillus sp. SO9 TaxID=2665646 RepID=UPI0018E6F6A2|nr:dihydroxyacetone kinase subunit DhaL [Alicyclobacillus sp. SO9]QQE77599.1 dihydroxyacetone kinase subunit L [Alicyclobacillus sp. SO9]
MTEFDVSAFSQFIDTYSQKLSEFADILNDLDNRIGDGDHGSNMSRGFKAAAHKLQESPALDPASASQTVAMSLLSTVGGASGPLYGTVFMKLAAAWKGCAVIDPTLMGNGFQAALDGLAARGKASLGDKTMVDVWTPAVAEMLKDNGAIDYERTCLVAKESALATKGIIAKRGRASYLGERSIGTCDPGSISSAMLFEALASILIEGMDPILWRTLAL